MNLEYIQLTKYPKIKSKNKIYLGDWCYESIFESKKTQVCLPYGINKDTKYKLIKEFDILFDAILKEFYQYNISIDNNELGVSLKNSIAVIGCQSYALHLSTMLQIKTFSSLPPSAPLSSLPHEEIIYLRDF